MTTHDKTANLTCAERLNAVMRLRLLRNTTGELSSHTGIELRNNSFSKKAPFIAKCIHSEFSRETEQRTGRRLDDLLADYRAASRYYDKIANTRKAQPEFHFNVLRCLMSAEFAESACSKPFRAAAEMADSVDISLLTLLILRMLPSYGSKSGDVDVNSFYEHLLRLRDYFRPLYDDGCVLHSAPYLTDSYRRAVRSIRNGELFTRLELIRFVQDIVTNLLNNTDPERLMQANIYYSRCRVHPMLENRYWTEMNFCSSSPVWWSFESIGDDYIAIRREYDMAMKHIVETRYELIIMRNDDIMQFALARHSALEYMCHSKPVPEELYMSGTCRVDDFDNPSRLCFEFAGNRYDDFPTVFEVSDNAAERIAAMIDDSWTQECETGEWEYMSVERVITSQYVYIERSCSTADDGCRRVESWYRIRRDRLLDNVDIDALVLHIRHNNEHYIVFVHYNRSFNVTDDEACRMSGVDVVKDISVEYIPQ